MGDPGNRYWIASLIFGIAILTVGDIATGLSANAFTIYFVMFLSTWIIFTVAIVSRGKAGSARAFGGIDKDWKLYLVIATSLVVGLVLSGHQLFGISSFPDFSIIVPLALTPAAIGASYGFTYFIDAFMAPFLEETWREGVLRPSLEVWLQVVGIGPTLFFLGGAVAFILLSSAFWIGIIIAIAGLVIWLVPKVRDAAIIKSSGKSILALAILAILSAIIASFLWAALHVFAYGQVPNFGSALLAVFALGIVFTVIDIVFWKSVIPGLIAHSVVNGIIVGSAVAAGYQGIAVGLIITTFLVVFTIMLFKGFFNSAAAKNPNVTVGL